MLLCHNESKQLFAALHPRPLTSAGISPCSSSTVCTLVNLASFSVTRFPSVPRRPRVHSNLPLHLIFPIKTSVQFPPPPRDFETRVAQRCRAPRAQERKKAPVPYFVNRNPRLSSDVPTKSLRRSGPFALYFGSGGLRRARQAGGRAGLMASKWPGAEEPRHAGQMRCGGEGEKKHGPLS